MSTRNLGIAAAILTLIGLALLALAGSSWIPRQQAPATPQASRTTAAAADPAQDTRPATATASSAPASPTPSTPSTTSSRATPAAAVASGELDLEEWATPDADQRRVEQEALQAATEAVAAFARPARGVSTAQWQQRVRAAVGESTWADLEAVDPARVTYTRVSGPARVLQQDTEAGPAAEDEQDAVNIVVPTDAGWWHVLVAQGEVAALRPMETGNVQ